MAKEELKEFQADGENSSIADPIDVSAGSRKADLKKSANPTADKVEDLEGQNKGEKLIGSQKGQAQAPARRADKRSVKEHVDEIFDGEEFSEELKTKIAAVFEAAVIERVAEREEELEEEFKAKLDEAVTELTAGVDAYLDEIVEEWLAENEVAVESATKVAVAESFMEGLKGLFVEHNVVLPEEGFDVVESLEAKVAELESKLNESEDAKIALKRSIEESRNAAVVAELSEGLTETQKDRLKNLAENLEYADGDEYRSKITAIRESFVEKKTQDAEVALNEEFEGTEEAKTVVDPMMESYLNAVSRTLKK